MRNREAADNRDGRTVSGQCLFIGDYKYWLMTHWDDVDLDSCPDDYVLNRARLYRDRRDFVIQPGDTGRPEDYPANPAR